ncbi:hemolysin family protein [Haematomicrobium sanguinis]|uniref:hemolysin family protein n=1 Tax=Haematomicrobium sanguinis TaxID=479106 RepID=UPI000558722F|nr:hemolysin family protein [Haematomicrobium sanguinis]
MEWLSLVFGLVLIAGTGFFVAVEFALVALDQPRVQRAIDNGDTAAVPLMKCLKTLSTQLSACQLGITVTTLLTGFVLEPAISHYLDPVLLGWGTPEALAKTISTLVAIALATLFSMLLGELIPKNLSIAEPFTVGKWVARPQLMFTAVFRPAINLLNGFANGVLARMGIEAKEELTGARTPDELSSLVRRSALMGTLDEGTANFLARTLQFGDRRADDVMTPRIRVEFLDQSDSVTDMLERSRKTGYSRFPIINDSPDDVVGVAHIKNAVAIPKSERASTPIATIMTDVLKVPETVELDSLLSQLRDANLQLAVALDEYGGTAGIVSLEDLVEEIIGDISDEHDKKLPGVLMSTNGNWFFPGMLRPDEASEQVPGLRVEDGPDYETIGGLIMAELGRVPERGDEIDVDGGVLQVARMDGHRVDRVMFRQAAPAESVAPAAPARGEEAHHE